MFELRLFLPIGKVDEAARTVYGTLTAEIADKSGEIFDYASGKPAVQAWSDEIKAASKGKSLGNVRAMHGNAAAGKFTDIVYDDANKRIEGAAKIVDDDEWAKVMEGVYTGFSIGGSYTKRWQDKDNPLLFRFTPKLSEISLVDNPCVPTATFEYLKADGTVEMRKFTPSHKEDSMDPKALAAAKDALAKNTATDEQKALVTTEADALLKDAQDAEAKGEATDDQKSLLAKAADAEAAKVAVVKDGKPLKPKTAPLQKWMANDGEAFDTKREAEIHNLELEKKSELAPALSQMDALLSKAAKPAEDDDEHKDEDDEDTKAKKKERREKKAKDKGDKEEAEKAEKLAKDAADKAAADELAKTDKSAGRKPLAFSVDSELEKKDYTDDERKEMADKKEAMPDGSFPIKTKKDLENAVQAYGRAKDKAKAKAHIMARAKALDAEDLLPADWTKKKEKAAPASDLQKGLHQVGWLARLLDDLQCLQNSVTIEQYFEDDKDSELPAKFKSLVAEMCEVLVTLVEEETSELTDGDNTDVDILEMAAGLPAGHPEAIAKAVRVNAEPLSKSDSKTESAKGTALVKLAEILEKAGARHSKVDADRVQELHDHAGDVHKAMGDFVEKCADMCKAAGHAKNTAIDLGAKGDKVDDEDDAQTDNRGAQKINKALAELALKNDELLVVGKIATAQNETLLKAIPLIEDQQKEIDKLKQENSVIAKRMEHLEKQPAAPKGHVRAISKAQDGGAGGETDAEHKARLEKMTPAARNRELMKLAMMNPQEIPVS